jgi:hypothetical protein
LKSGDERRPKSTIGARKSAIFENLKGAKVAPELITRKFIDFKICSTHQAEQIFLEEFFFQKCLVWEIGFFRENSKTGKRCKNQKLLIPKFYKI